MATINNSSSQIPSPSSILSRSQLSQSNIKVVVRSIIQNGEKKKTLEMCMLVVTVDYDTSIKYFIRILKANKMRRANVKLKPKKRRKNKREEREKDELPHHYE